MGSGTKMTGSIVDGGMRREQLLYWITCSNCKFKGKYLVMKSFKQFCHQCGKTLENEKKDTIFLE